ncbi:MAG: 3-isopropylmalate dehydratase small subunit [Thaumarchaeota archaeon]|nr:3-isopropylmalate dehydratase small subunit [Nitrososphaerota archaeon]
MKLRGFAHKFGDNIDTDEIIPGPYLKEQDPRKLAEHAMEGADPEFVKKVRPGDFIVAGRNFGCGSSREHAPLALRYSGVKAVLALSFARIFYRNSVDGGHLLPVEIGIDAYEGIGDGDELELDLDEGLVKDLTTGKGYRVKPIPELVRRIIEAGGLFSLKPEELL